MAEIAAGIQAELDVVVRQMSTWDAGSALSRFNQAPAGTWVEVPGELYYVLDHALRVAQETGGAFDPTVGRLVNLWGFGPDCAPGQVPAHEETEALRATQGWRRLRCDPSRRRVRQPGGVSIDFSAIAKGFGVDQVSDYLDRLGLGNHLVEVGGELRGQGGKGGLPWWVELERPDGAGRGDVLALHGLSVATSGDYRRYFEAAGVRYAHTMDPHTGRPVTSALAAVTVVHISCMAADALSTALTVLGAEEGMEHAARHRIAARFVERRGSAYVEFLSPAMEEMLR
jgi:thiamine biosynthesis lipoprotein